MAKEVWGGRFKKELDPEIKEFTSSLSYDKKLAFYDIEGSIAHAKMLGKCKIISSSESGKIVKGLSKVKRLLKGNILSRSKAEDIHLAITALLEKEIGKLAGKLHIARSRNDQVALDLRMYCKDEIDAIVKVMCSLQACILKGAEKFARKNTTMPSYTHLKRAQCILLSHQLLAYIEMLERDKARLIDLYKRVDVMPLGSSAHRGTALPIDRFYTAKQLGFSKVSENSIDAVSDRDFVVEFLSALAILSMHLSRIAEDFIIWSSDEFAYVEGHDAHYTGSSMMPNKKNPDPLELMRGYSGQIYGNLMSSLVMLKGLPHAYNRDMQLDKPALFEAVGIIKASLPVLEKVLYGLKVNEDILKKACEKDYIFATDICEYLEKKKYSCWEAHGIAGKMVGYALDKGKYLKDLSLGELKRFSKDLDRKIIKKLINPVASVESVKSYGGTSPSSVKRQIKKWKERLKA